MLGPTMRLAVGCLVLVALVPVGVIAQPEPAPASGIGTIAGQVLDASSGDPIIEAGVEVIGAGKTVRTDLDGKFIVKVPPGTYQVRFFAPLYTGARLDRIVVQPDKVTKADVTLSSGDQAGIEVVEVIADADKAAERTQLLRRQKAPVVSDNIAAETIKKSPDSDAAEVVARVPAVTIKDDKFVVVRGLGERYSSALLEGSRLPSSDPSKRVVPLDLFPADFIESISIVKTYTPDLPGDFSGGLADIRLIEFPEKLSYNFGVSTGGNSEATFQDFDTYKGGGFDYFGFDQNVRSLPSLIPDRNLGEGSLPQAQRVAYARSFKNIWEPYSETAPPNFGTDFSVGNTFGPLGLRLAANYSTEYSVRRDRIERTFLNAAPTIDDPPVILPGDDFRFDESVFETKLGGLLTSAYNLAPGHRISMRSLITRHTTDEVEIGTGTTESRGDTIQDSTSLRFVQEELAFGQFAGEHRFPWLDVDWRTAFSRTTQEVPDNRITLRFDGGADNSIGAQRTFYDLTEYLTDSQIDMTIPFATGLPFTSVWSGLPAKFKFGPAYALRDRDSRLRIFRFGPAVDPQLPFEEIYAPENLGPPSQFVEDSRPQNDFAATEEVIAGYGMFDLPLIRNRLRFVGGVRTEYAYTVLETFNPIVSDFGSIIRNELDPLPGANLIYTPRDDMNVRFGYGRSVSRPEFQELSPTSFPQPRGLRPVQGNPNLVQSDIESFDLRWEWFLSPGEVLALSGFYKMFDKPIEAAVSNQTSNAVDTFANAEDATLAGFEFEARKNLGFVWRHLSNVDFQTNVAYIDSEVNAPRSPTQRQTSTKRPLQGQAPFVVNAAVEYTHPRWGTARLLYNTAGRRIAVIGVNGLPDEHEERRDQIDLVFLTKVTPFGTPLNLKFAVENILDDDYLFTQEDNVRRKYNTGAKFSFGVSYSY